MLEPTPIELPQPVEPSGNVIVRTVRAPLIERRLPTTLQTRYDQLLTRVGLGIKQLAVGEYRFAIRRMQTDRHYVHDVVVRGEYDAPGYELSPNETVVDIGANIGAFSVMAGRKVSPGKVIAVEPMADNLALLRRNIALNQLTNVEVVAAAVVGEATNFVEMERSSTNSGAHSVRIPGEQTSKSVVDYGNSNRVAGLTLTQVFEQHDIERCHLLKIDCEGAEFSMFRHADSNVFARVDRIVMEYHGQSMSSKLTDARELLTQLEQLGFGIDAFLDYRGTNLGIIRARKRSRL